MADSDPPNSGERTSGWRAALRVPWIYTLLQDAAGAQRVRRRFAETYVRAQPGERVLDIGCGPGEMLPVLPGVAYVGVDHSAAYIAAAKSRFGGRGEFLVGDAGDLAGRLDGRFDVVLGVALLHHLDDEHAASFVRTAAQLLLPGGRLVTFDCAFTTRQNPIARALIRNDRGQHVRTPDGYEQLVRREFQEVASDVRTDLNWIPYTHFMMVCREPKRPDSRELD